MNTGEWLEQLIKNIEHSCLPEGFTINKREKKYGTSGKHIAEFDLVIHGELGSTEIKWLIECRDRPSKGHQGGDWIEQLVGRKNRFNFDKVTAVSTTGFTEDAIDYAKQAGIEVRSITKLDPQNTPWLGTQHSIHNQYTGELILQRKVS